MNPLKVIERWISKHGSTASLREQVGLLKHQQAALEAETSGLKSRLKDLEAERDFYKTKAENFQAQLNKAQEEIEKLNGLRVALKLQTQLEQQISQLKLANNEFERRLRTKSMG